MGDWPVKPQLPFVPGHELVGVVERLGPEVSGVRVGDRVVGRVPDAVDPLDAAPLTCAGVTTYKAIRVSVARSSDLVATFGVGGLGHMALQYAPITGASVVAVDVSHENLQLAKELGAEYTVNAAQEDPVDAIQRLGGADAAIALAAAPKPFDQAFSSLRRGGDRIATAMAKKAAGDFRSREHVADWARSIAATLRPVLSEHA